MLAYASPEEFIQLIKEKVISAEDIFVHALELSKISKKSPLNIIIEKDPKLLIELTKRGELTFENLSQFFFSTQSFDPSTALHEMLKISLKNFYELITVLKDPIKTLAMEKLGKASLFEG